MSQNPARDGHFLSPIIVTVVVNRSPIVVSILILILVIIVVSILVLILVLILVDNDCDNVLKPEP